MVSRQACGMSFNVAESGKGMWVKSKLGSTARESQSATRDCDLPQTASVRYRIEYRYKNMADRLPGGEVSADLSRRGRQNDPVRVLWVESGLRLQLKGE